MKKTKILMLLATCFVWVVFVIHPIQGQTTYTLAPSSELKIVGKSNIRTWTLTSTAASGKGQFMMEGTQLKAIQNLWVEMESESLKSGNKALDKHAYEALKKGEYMHIKFDLKEITGTGNIMEARGNLSIAGVTKEVKFPVKVSQKENQINFKGELPIKFSDFNIETPTNLMGLIKTLDDAKIYFNTDFTK
jgi:polyisoprenoid-binding protein YceI